MNVAAILKLKGREVFTAPPDTPLHEIAKLLGIHRIGCIVAWTRSMTSLSNRRWNRKRTRAGSPRADREEEETPCQGHS